MDTTVGHTRESSVSRWATVLWGIAALVVGLLFVTQPVVTVVFVVQVIATLWLVGGILDIAFGIVNRGGRGRTWPIIEGVVAIIAGVILLANPLVGGLLVVLFQFYIIAFAAIVNGIVNIVSRFQGFGGWGRVVLGIMQLAIGVFFVFNPIPAVLALIPVLGMLVALGGVITIAAALFLRPSASPAAQPV